MHTGRASSASAWPVPFAVRKNSLSRPLAGAGLQQQEQRACSDACRCQWGPAPAGGTPTVYRFHPCRPGWPTLRYTATASSLPGAKLPMRKVSTPPALHREDLAVLLLAVGPGRVARAQRLKVRLQIGGGVGFDQLGLLPRAGFARRPAPPAGAEPPGSGTAGGRTRGPGPVQGARWWGAPVELAPVGLDLFELLAGNVKPSARPRTVSCWNRPLSATSASASHRPGGPAPGGGFPPSSALGAE